MESMNEIEDQHFIDISESSSDDSDNDPSYCDLKETCSKLSNLSIKNKSRARDEIEEIDDGMEIVEPELDEADQKSFEEVQRIIRDGNIEKLKIDQCKVYLRKNGLRLTGNKATLIQRINEHLEILNGGGERKYPVSSFFINCKGDACTGDVVLFEQNVYEMYNIASRSASGPACGTRMVAGRIVKESYGAAKQQHTFTVEVLWSKGEKPLPPLHPLLIKGRNLYRLKTLRRRWEDEGQRRKILMEKHSRGFVARSNRDVRIQQKENRKMLNPNRVSKKESRRDQSQSDKAILSKPSAQLQHLGFSRNLAPNYGKSENESRAQNQSSCAYYDKVTSRVQSEKESIHNIDRASQRLVENGDTINRPNTLHPGNNQTRSHNKRPYVSRWDQMSKTENLHQHPFRVQSEKESIHNIDRASQRLVENRDTINRPSTLHPGTGLVPTMCNNQSHSHNKRSYVSRWDQMSKTENLHQHPFRVQSEKESIHNIDRASQRLVENRDTINRPSTLHPGTGLVPTMCNNQSHSHNKRSYVSRWDQMSKTENFHQHSFKSTVGLEPCPYYPQGRCNFGDKCKFSHVTRE